jgi:hypothetical protein
MRQYSDKIFVHFQQPSSFFVFGIHHFNNLILIEFLDLQELIQEEFSEKCP